MSLNQVSVTGELERRAGLVNSEKINEMYEAFPSDASASNKLVATNAIYKTLNRSWNNVGNRFIKLSNAYPAIGLKTNNYIVSCRNGETYLLLCGTTDGGYTVTPKVYLLYGGTGKLTTNGFYYDSTTNEIAFMTQGYNSVSVTQISGEVKDIILSEISETNPLSNPVVITPQKLVTESDLTKSFESSFNVDNLYVSQGVSKAITTSLTQQIYMGTLGNAIKIRTFQSTTNFFSEEVVYYSGSGIRRTTVSGTVPYTATVAGSLLTLTIPDTMRLSIERIG